MKSRLLLFLLLIICSCKQPATTNPFNVTLHDTKIESAIHKAFPYEGGIIGQYCADSFFAFDKEMIHSHALEQQMEQLTYIINYADTIWIGDSSKQYFLNGHDLYAYNGLPSQDPSLPNGSMDKERYNDHDYYVYSCCMGEFGGPIYFLNKKNRRLTTYPLPPCCTQVVKYKNTFVAYSSLVHMGYSQGRTSFMNPDKLFKQQYQSSTSTQTMLKEHGNDFFCCNCNTSDSLQHALFQSVDNKWNSIKESMAVIEFNQNHLPAFRLAFLHDKNLFIIRESDSAFHISHQADTSETQVQMIRKNRITTKTDRIEWMQTKYGNTYLAHSHNTIITVNGNIIRILQDTSIARPH